jgi:hypothetical protein
MASKTMPPRRSRRSRHRPPRIPELGISPGEPSPIQGCRWRTTTSASKKGDDARAPLLLAPTRSVQSFRLGLPPQHPRAQQSTHSRCCPQPRTTRDLHCEAPHSSMVKIACIRPAEEKPLPPSLGPLPRCPSPAGQQHAAPVCCHHPSHRQR